MSTNTKLAEPVNAVAVLRNVLNTLKRENDKPDGSISDTIWYSAYETLLDYVESSLEALAAHDAEQAAKAVPAGFVLVPVEVLEDAATAIGHFVSDHGWSDEDMQAMDNLDAYIARHKANAAPATPGPAPAEQAQAGDRAMASDWSWTGVRMELEASGRDDLSAWVSQQIEPKAHAGEPVVPYLYVYEYDSPFGLNREFYPSGWNGQKPTRTVPLYTTPQPAQAERVGLTDEQIAEGRYRTWAAEPEDAPEAWSFLRGARWAESALAVRWGVKLGATTGQEPGND